MKKAKRFIEDFLEYYNDSNMPMAELVSRAREALEQLNKEELNK